LSVWESPPPDEADEDEEPDEDDEDDETVDHPDETVCGGGGVGHGLGGMLAATLAMHGLEGPTDPEIVPFMCARSKPTLALAEAIAPESTTKPTNEHKTAIG
jgi:hypothetical protein